MVNQPAALDTSFWTVGHRADVVSYLFDYFVVHVPPAVRDEILAVDPDYPRRIYGYASLFRVLESRGLLPAELPAQAFRRFGRGEAEALALAQERGWWLLMNDSRPSLFAAQVGISTLSVPSFVFYLYEREVLSLASAELKLRIIAEYTSQSVMQPALQALDQLARARKEREE